MTTILPKPLPFIKQVYAFKAFKTNSATRAELAGFCPVTSFPSATAFTCCTTIKSKLSQYAGD